MTPFVREIFQLLNNANGGNWWILIPEENSNCFYTILYDNQGSNSNRETMCWTNME